MIPIKQGSVELSGMWDDANRSAEQLLFEATRPPVRSVSFVTGWRWCQLAEYHGSAELTYEDGRWVLRGTIPITKTPAPLWRRVGYYTIGWWASRVEALWHKVKSV